MPGIVAGVVLFNPDVDCLRRNIEAILDQVDKVVAFNNGIPSSVAELCSANNVEILHAHSNTNKGVAYAYNIICEYAYSNGYEWVLTLDQDSIAPDNLISEYKKYMHDDSIGMMCPRICDRNYGYDSATEESVDGSEFVHACISSASMLRLDAWKKIGGFWDGLFIDMVDMDICWNLHRHGYRILKLNKVVLSHSIGNGKKVVLRGKEEIVYNHSAIRDYYIIRNTILVGKRYDKMNQCARWAIKRFLLIIRFETSRLAKIKYMLLGLNDGLIGRDGSFNNLHPKKIGSKD